MPKYYGKIRQSVLQRSIMHRCCPSFISKGAYHQTDKGNTATTTITVNAVTTGNYIRLTSNIESDIAPLEVTLRIGGSFSIETSLNVSGPVQPKITFVSADEYTVRMVGEGTYYNRATVTGPD